MEKQLSFSWNAKGDQLGTEKVSLNSFKTKRKSYLAEINKQTFNMKKQNDVFLLCWQLFF